MKISRLCGVLAVLALVCASAQAADKLKALIVDGQNNHDWKGTTPVLKWILEDCGRFTVDVTTTPPSAPRAPQAPKSPATEQQKAAHAEALAKWKAEKAELEQNNIALWKQWHPKFSDYAVIVLNYNGDKWPDAVRADFLSFVRNGGGVVSYHAADNAFSDWPEFNAMIGVGGWGGRNEKSGPMTYWEDGKIVRDETPGAGGTHGPQHEFVVETRVSAHPIMQGLPAKWLHSKDELYSKLRGPAQNYTVLATAFADPAQKGSGHNEPMLMVISYEKGRIFHTTLGHGPAAMVDVGFQATLQRGTEWAATGAVTLPPPPADKMPADKVGTHEMPK
jgi:type 1 glutamine amidotransferase